MIINFHKSSYIYYNNINFNYKNEEFHNINVRTLQIPNYINIDIISFHINYHKKILEG
jgi:hypothetical protein